MSVVRRSVLNPHAPEYIPIATPPPPVLLPPPPTVDLLPRENVRPPSVTRPGPNIPPRLRNDYIARRGGGGGQGFSRSSKGKRGGFGRGNCSSEGRLVWRRTVENDQRQGVFYDKWSRNDGLKKHDVIPISWTHKNSTTVMIKNVPYHYNREMLMKFLDQHCLLENQKAKDSNGENTVFAYDFLYLPMDFKKERSKGYAFVNFTDHRTVWNFFCVFNDKLNVFPGSARSVKIVNAKIQGKEALVNRFKQTRFDCESEGFLPVWFSPPRDGYGKSVQMITVGQYKVTPSCSYLLKKPQL
ncbi:protein terminal ear1 homolog [Solanum dulcamara]|uniref:protein terminal ear1 homolog n=1 Tax=Solanum dulcamara TaxID=45834 RepID=UPI0024868975|nr:protein terminal ear1 homolog [Solanum dulcamara]